MRFMISVRATKDTEAGVPPEEKLVAAMATYHEELVKAGVLLDANGLHPSSKGFRVRWRAGKQTLVDGPFAETKELIAGYTVIQVKSRAEALEWAKRFPAPFGADKDGEIEVRQLYELDELGAAESIDRFRDIEIATRK
ncbi:MAG TPA: YciI family protein [Gammaproteobacteria bacterium]|nr:YciI family protein [Gammaproteobacteria bacterium]